MLRQNQQEFEGLVRILKYNYAQFRHFYQSSAPLLLTNLKYDNL